MIAPTIVCGLEGFLICINGDHMLLRKKKLLRVSHYSFMAIAYFNRVNCSVDFEILEDTTCFTFLRSKLDNMFLDTENKKVSKIEFHAPWIGIDGNVIYNHIKLKTDEDLKVVWRTYHCRLTKESIEFDATTSRLSTT